MLPQIRPQRQRGWDLQPGGGVSQPEARDSRPVHGLRQGLAANQSRKLLHHGPLHGRLHAPEAVGEETVAALGIQGAERDEQPDDGAHDRS